MDGVILLADDSTLPFSVCVYKCDSIEMVLHS